MLITKEEKKGKQQTKKNKRHQARHYVTSPIRAATRLLATPFQA
jgi:hypothetical protein